MDRIERGTLLTTAIQAILLLAALAGLADRSGVVSAVWAAVGG